MGPITERLRERLDDINARIDTAAKKSGRNGKDIKLIGVSKKAAIDVIKGAFDLGLEEFAESRVQEFIPKQEALPLAKWHFIGRLQTNKVKYIIDKVEMIHSLDSIKLAEEINRQAKNKGLKVKVLAEINISGESSKTGIEPKQCENFLRKISQYENLDVKGLMTIAPFTQNRQEIRSVFGNLYKLFVDIAEKEIHNIYMEYLSAGMTNDFELAIEEGVNIVRIGTGIFGTNY
ncbi:MAG: YggS family pyridoxal phosphate-dependent enzyme [Deltaproteobacteria bacterium]